jgi:hypothetical protein
MPGEEDHAVSLTGRKRRPDGNIDTAVVLYLEIAIQREEGEGGEEGQCMQRACFHKGHRPFTVEPINGEFLPTGWWVYRDAAD